MIAIEKYRWYVKRPSLYWRYATFSLKKVGVGWDLQALNGGKEVHHMIWHKGNGELWVSHEWKGKWSHATVVKQADFRLAAFGSQRCGERGDGFSKISTREQCAIA